MENIGITEIKDIRIGQAENREAGTGVTVLICEKGCWQDWMSEAAGRLPEIRRS